MLDLNYAMMETQRDRVARGVAEENRSGVNDKNVSVDLKRLNAFVVTHNDLVSSPQAKGVEKQRPGTGPVSEILKRLISEESRRPK